MKISSSQLNVPNAAPQLRAQESTETAEQTAPRDSFTLSEELYDFKTNAVMAGGMGLVGGLGGAIPVVGIFTNGHSNEAGAGTFTKATAVAASAANLITSGLVLTGAAPAWSMAIPSALGAVSWASFAVDTRNHH